MSYSTTDYYRQNQDYRGGYTPQAQAKRPPPADGEEQWYLDGGPSNRMALALLSGIPREVEWALSRLVNLSDEHTSRFVLSAVPKLTESILAWPEMYIEEGSQKNAEPFFSYFAPTPSVEGMRKHAIESVLTLRNASHNDLNATHLAQNPRVLKVLNAIIALPPSEVNTELIIYALELLQVIGPFLPSLSKGKSPYGAIPTQHLDDIVASSNDRAIIVPSLNVLTLLMTTNPAIPPDSPDFYHPPYIPDASSPALARVIRFLALVHDPGLLTSSLEFISTYLSSPSASKTFLSHPDLGTVVRLLVAILRYEQKTEVRTVPLGPPVRTAESVEQLPYELTEEDLARLVPLPEPERSFEWMKTMFEAWPGSEQTQVSFWTLYKDTFTPYSDYPMLQAADIIRNVTIQFQEANASVVHGTNQRFVIQNIRRRLKAPTPLEYKCQWDADTCASPLFDSVKKLHEHILTHLSSISDPDITIKCAWSICDHSATLSVLKHHILTHLPPSSPAQKHPSQPISITLPYSPEANYPPSTPSARPAPPPPVSTVSYTIPTPSTQTPATALLALYALRLLFWAAFPNSGSAAVPVADENRFGFPSLPLSHREQKEELGQGEQRDAERKGQRAFKNVRNSLLEVHVPDEGIMGWVVDMLLKTDDDAELEDAVHLPSESDTATTT